MKGPIFYSRKVSIFIVSYTLIYLLLIVLIPLSSIFFKAGELNWNDWTGHVFNARSIAAYKLTFLTSLIAATINSIFGFITAWVLVRYEFPGKKILDTLVDFPFALPTAVAGLTFVEIYSKDGLIGNYFERIGIQISYTPIAIVLVLTFVGLPFVIRSVQPVLEEMDLEVEQAARSLGASDIQIFFYVILPYILPAWITGFTLSFARAIGEYGSVIFVSGNIPFKTEIAPLLIVTRLEQFDYAGASAIAIVLLGFSFSLLIILNIVERWSRRYEEI
ncbi:MAG: sulfate ABC transporter permease subunit CysT [Leptospiraceae bacterium]|nr:sulfate ABC transporter permease subunit CysT [Leptospiraceae bacterium]